MCDRWLFVKLIGMDLSYIRQGFDEQLCSPADALLIGTYLLWSCREARRIIKGVVTILVSHPTEDKGEESEVSDGRQLRTGRRQSASAGASVRFR
jgi:hypothetical protein